MRAIDREIDQHWQRLNAVKAELADCQYRLQIARRDAQEELIVAWRRELAPDMEKLAALLEDADEQFQFVARMIQKASTVFPLGQAPISPTILAGRNSVVASTLRRVLERLVQMHAVN